jgi:hypothetical protein
MTPVPRRARDVRGGNEDVDAGGHRPDAPPFWAALPFGAGVH